MISRFRLAFEDAGCALSSFLNEPGLVSVFGSSDFSLRFGCLACCETGRYFLDDVVREAGIARPRRLRCGLALLCSAIVFKRTDTTR